MIGAGMSGAWVPVLSTVARWFVKRRSMMTGIVTSGVGIGTLVTASVASWLIFSYGWRTAYIVVAGIVLTVLVFAGQFLKRDPAQVGQRPYGESGGGELGPGIEGESFSLKQAVHTGRFWLAVSILFSTGYFVSAIMVHIVPHAIDIGFSPANAAGILSLMAGLSIIGRITLGSAADRFGIKQVLAISLVLMSAAFLWLLTAREPWMLIPFVVVYGFAWGGFMTLGSPLVGRLFGLKSHGLLFGVINTGFTFGSAFAPFLTGYIFDVTGSYQLAFILCFAFSILGLILTATLKLSGGK
jgi:MFS family permease